MRNATHNGHDVMTTENGEVVRFGDLHIAGEIIIVDVMTRKTLHDGRKDGGDVDPLMTMAPVSWIVLMDGVAVVYVFTDWDWIEEAGK